MAKAWGDLHPAVAGWGLMRTTTITFRLVEGLKLSKQRHKKNLNEKIKMGEHCCILELNRNEES